MATSNPSPLSRYVNTSREIRDLTSALDTSSFPALHRVRRWKAMVVRSLKDNGNPSPAFQYFCEAAYESFQQSLTISVYSIFEISKWSNGFYKLPCWPNRTEHEELTQMWQPLEICRNLDALNFEANPEVRNPDLEQELKSLVTSDAPVVHVFTMYRQLLAYAQAFERHHPFKAAMDTCKRVRLLLVPPRISSNGGSWDGSPSLDHVNTPFLYFTCSPACAYSVEFALWGARMANDRTDLAGFKDE